MTRLDIRLLGGFQACLGGEPPLVLAAKAQALLAYLALRPGTGHPRDKIAALLWGATSDAQARANLRHTVFTLRKALGDAFAERERLRERLLIADIHLGLGELYASIDKRLEARAELTAAADLYRATEVVYRLPRVDAALARIAE